MASLNDLASHMIKVHGEIEALKKNIAEMIAVSGRKSGREMEALRMEIAGMKTDLDRSKVGGELRMGALKAVIAETKSDSKIRKIGVDMRMEALRREIAGMKSELDGRKNEKEIEALRKDVATIKIGIGRREIGREVEELRKEIAGAKLELQRIAGGEMGLEALKKEIAGMKTDLDRSRTVGELRMGAFVADVNEIKFDIKVRKSGVDMRMEALRKEVGEMRSELDRRNSDGEIEALRKEITGLKTDLDRTKTSAEIQTGESWRLKGNEAYEAGHMVKAEEYYTKSASCLPRRDPLLLCYTKRADARMRLGKVRDALWDCELAAEIEPSCLELHITAAKCHLLLGEVAAVKKRFENCKESGDSVCLDRRFILEAAEGLKEVQRVEEYRNDCEELMQQRNSDSTANALSLTDEALSISPFSEKLLELKGKALLMLHKYEKVIQLCEKTLDLAEKNFPVIFVQANVGGCWCKLWRWNLMSKAYFHLGRLERALELIKEQDLLRSGKNVLDSSQLFATALRDILKHKNAGDKAFNAERYTQAVEHYSAALSRSTGSRPVAAMCFSNRAAAHLKLNHFADAIADCNLAIALCGNYCEAILVRAASYIRAREYGHAANDVARLVSALEMQPPGNFETTNISDMLACCNIEDLQGAHNSLLSAGKMAKGGTSLDLYLVLGAKESDTAAAIKKAYREAALRHHPDKVVGKFVAESGDDGQLRDEIGDEIRRNADVLFKLIAESFEVLADPTKRSTYDLEEEQRRAEEGKGGGNCPIPTTIKKLLEDLGFI